MPQNKMTISGHCDRRFGKVAHEFESNFKTRGELGASVAVTYNGEVVVDLWGGVADAQSGAPWGRETITTLFSTTKGAAAICMHVLIDRDLLDPDERVAAYWPEFASNGKDNITVAMVMSHQAGLPFWQEPLPAGSLLDWELATSRLAHEAPIWEPGTRHGYHALTLGYLEGEILRRITGKTIGQFLREDVAGPLDADVWIGLPQSEEHRVAPLILPDPDPNSPLHKKITSDPDWEGLKIWNDGGLNGEDNLNSRANHAAEIPAAGGIGNARGLARLYAPLALDGSIGGLRIVSPRAMSRMSTVRSASTCDLILRFPTTFTLGFSKSWGDRRMGQGNHAIVGEGAFGTVGLGGSFGFADPDAKLSIAYAMNRLGQSIALNDRGQTLIDAAYESVGFHLNSAGQWAN